LSEPGYDGTIPLSGGTGTYSDLVVTGLPSGLTGSLSGSTITVSGTPTQSGTFNNVAVSLEDNSGTKGNGTETLTITDPAINLGNLSPAQWIVNHPGYEGTIAVTGGTGSYSNLQLSGLPGGLSAQLSGSTITVSGTPTQIGTFTLTTSLQDSSGKTGGGTESLTITPVSLTLGNLTPAQWTVNQAGYKGTISVSGGSGGYQDLQVSGLPNGLSATVQSSTAGGAQSGTIKITGTPTQSGRFTLQVSLEDGDGDSGNGTEKLTVNAAKTSLQVTLQQIEQIIPPPPAPGPKPTLGPHPTPKAQKAYAKKLAAWEKAVANSNAYPTLVAGLVNFLNSNQAISTDQINTQRRQAAFIGQVAVETANLTTLTQGSNFGTVGTTSTGEGYLQLTGSANDNAATNYLRSLLNQPKLTLQQTLVDLATNPQLAADASGWFWNGGTGVKGINQYAEAWNITAVSSLVNAANINVTANNLAERIAASNKALAVVSQ
jgi:predicted chitinase